MIEQPESCVIFCNTRITVDRVQGILSRQGYNSQALHGDIPQVKRLKTLQQFKQGEFHLLVATDVAARGIHIDDLSLVINYDVPIEKDGYVHRIGRTGRAGNGGRAITLVTGEDIMSLYEIEEHIGARIEEAELPSEAVFNERRASIDKWIQANSQKINAPRAVSDSNLKETQKKRSSTKPAQHYDKRREPSIAIKTDNRTSPRVNPVHPAEQARPVPAIVKPVSPPSPEADVVNNILSPEVVANQDSTTKKPFFKRILERILG